METSDFLTKMQDLSTLQIDFIAARIGATSDAEAARIVGITPSVICQWKNAGCPIDEIVREAKINRVLLAREKIERAIPQAIDALIAELQGKRKIEAAKELLDRGGIEAGHKVDVTSAGQKLDMLGGMRDLLARRLDTLLDS